MISWAEILSSTKPGHLEKAGAAVVAGAVVAASAVVVAGDEEAAVAAVGAVAEAGTVTAGTAAAAETAAGNRAVQLRNLNLEPGRPPWRSPFFISFVRPYPGEHTYGRCIMHE